MFGDDTIAVGGATNVTLTITTQPDAVHSPMNVEIIMPFEENAPVLRICKAEIIAAGENLPCFDRERRNASVYYTNRCFNTLMFTNSVLSFQPLSNK